MKKFLEELKGARRIEWFLIILAVCLILLTWNNENSDNVHNLTEQEQRICSVLRKIEGVGELEIMISENNSGGILVVAEGAEDLNVCLRIQYAIHTLLGTEISKIEIIPHQK